MVLAAKPDPMALPPSSPMSFPAAAKGNQYRHRHSHSHCSHNTPPSAPTPHSHTSPLHYLHLKSNDVNVVLAAKPDPMALPPSSPMPFPAAAKGDQNKHRNTNTNTVIVGNKPLHQHQRQRHTDTRHHCTTYYSNPMTSMWCWQPNQPQWLCSLHPQCHSLQQQKAIKTNKQRNTDTATGIAAITALNQHQHQRHAATRHHCTTYHLNPMTSMWCWQPNQTQWLWPPQLQCDSLKAAKGKQHKQRNTDTNTDTATTALHQHQHQRHAATRHHCTTYNSNTMTSMWCWQPNQPQWLCHLHPQCHSLQQQKAIKTNKERSTETDTATGIAAITPLHQHQHRRHTNTLHHCTTYHTNTMTSMWCWQPNQPQ